MLSAIQQYYYAWDISHKKSVSDDTLFTGVLSEARVDLNPHQVEAALFAFKSPLSKGAILADEVGLGKTIEAGIILSELWAENKRKILIVVPASLRNQWNIELMDKFYLPSIILDRSTMDEVKSLSMEGRKKIIICSYNFASKQIGFLRNRAWDLVVFDEAHKLRNVYRKSNVIANTLKEAFQPFKKILLTATPLQNNLKELYGLISMIDGEFFSGVTSFADQYNAVTTRDKAKYGQLKGRISHIIHRTLRKQVEEYVNFTKRRAIVQEYVPSKAELDLYDHVTAYLQRKGTYGIPEGQRSLLTLLVRKIMSSSAFALAFTLERFIHRLEAYKESGQLDSSLRMVMEDFEGGNDEYEFEENQASEMSVDKDSLQEEIDELQGYCDLARSIGDESKALRLLDALQVSFEKIKQLGGSRKALVFTESRKTQEYLYRFLSEHGYEKKVVLFNGTNDSLQAKQLYQLWLLRYGGSNRISGNTQIDKKQAIVDTFCDEAEIMIATEAGSEGINLQFCSLVVNYDMPWNPQRIEQRIGRCHRYGQRNDVVVVNFVNKANYADCRVYELLQDKFSLFDGVFGASDEVLGCMDSGVDFERKLNSIYNTCRTHREIEEAFNELQRELEETIKARIASTKKSLLENFDEEVVNKLRMRQEADTERMNSYTKHLWEVSKSILNDKITELDDLKHTFRLIRPINEDIPVGTYILNRDSDRYIQLRFGHPLGQYVVKQALSLVTPDSELVFDLSSYPFRSSLLEQYKGRGGTACVYRVTISNQCDNEELLIGCAQTSEREKLPDEFVFKLLELNCISERIAQLKGIENQFSSDFEKRLNDYVSQVQERTDSFLYFEISKLEAWSEDRLTPLKKEIEALYKEHNALLKEKRRAKGKDYIDLTTLCHQKDKLLSSKRTELHELEAKYNCELETKLDELRMVLMNKVDKQLVMRFNWQIQ